ncbi:MAG: NrdH-redoxin [Candidatus Wildermuthbacteria bacterium RIFCSPLOWO2_01_FULL_48_29]|uniref:NrdH-redoxin n=1 Tax=Candidatus Wildermuthbacteria bacterium RIFCSPLOWO2_01_FULL_48_29 TaxID=1802462 RepID=A0A1G2RPZ5_9BACT|nr:MAG: NrdH-redoxin [Candidatus Wildermuthbacteria bacterium RIFCSPLOWO2_01_FULL_48_29]
MAKVTIYTTPTCVYCRAAKEFFADHKVQYEEKDVARDEQARNDMVQKSGQLGVPVITVDDEVVIGFDESRLSELLGVKK